MIYPHVIEVERAPEFADPKRKPQRDWANSTSHEQDQVQVQPTTPTDVNIGDGTPHTTDLQRIIGQIGVHLDLQEGDRVRWPLGTSEVWELVGTPNHWLSPIHGGFHHDEAMIRRIEVSHGN